MNNERLIGLGLDLSLRGTGLVVWDGKQVLRHGCLETEPMPKAVKDRATGLRVRRDGSSVFRGDSREQRIEWVRRKVVSTVRTFPIGLACVEGYSFASKGSSMTDLAELRGVILNVLFRNDVPVDIIAPPTLKKIATGNGRAEKDEMIRKARRKWKRCPDNDNVADGFWLAHEAQRRYEDSCSF
jgi:Holliday junction resolvasome RuvABC endonuclease subunit